MGYGYSAWLVPDNRDIIDTEHIPHVTIETGLRYPQHPSVGHRLEICFSGGIAQIPKMYPDTDDVLDAYGFYCKLFDLEGRRFQVNHEPHLTLHYGLLEDTTRVPCPDNCTGTVYIADTRSDCPREWKLILG